jgi:hypothetical protein
MEYENTLAKNISGAGNDAVLDAACKRLFSNKAILARILKDCVEEYKDCDISDIEGKYIENEPQIAEVAVHPDETNASIHGISNEDATLTEGTVTYDIRFIATAPVSDEHIQLIINIEAQNDFYPGYPLVKRGIYYCSRMISAQYGTEFEQSRYGDIKKVYSIWICAKPPKNREHTITSYSLTEKNIIGNVHEPIENYDLMTAVMICLGSEDEGSENNILRLLEVLLSTEVQAEKKKQILQEDFNIKMTETLDEEVSDMCNISKGIREDGRAEGRAEGRVEERVEAIRNLMRNMKLTSEQAMEALSVPKSEYSKYEDMLKEAVSHA